MANHWPEGRPLGFCPICQSPIDIISAHRPFTPAVVLPCGHELSVEQLRDVNEWLMGRTDPLSRSYVEPTQAQESE